MTAIVDLRYLRRGHWARYNFAGTSELGDEKFAQNHFRMGLIRYSVAMKGKPPTDDYVAGVPEVGWQR